jgi:hypothetical protein
MEGRLIVALPNYGGGMPRYPTTPRPISRDPLNGGGAQCGPVATPAHTRRDLGCTPNLQLPTRSRPGSSTPAPLGVLTYIYNIIHEK